MPRLAHLSDTHILDRDARDASKTGAGYRFRIKAVSLGRAIDPRGRAAKLARSLLAAKASGADHVVISGDLTELGERRELELFAEVLHESGLPTDRVTLVPGNHDAYSADAPGREGAWKRAIEGPLAPWAGASAGALGKVVERDGFVLLPVDTTRHQTILRSGGAFSGEAAEALARRLEDVAFRDKPVVAVLHHPPFIEKRRSGPVWRWIDGLGGTARVDALIERFPQLHVLHGHMHRAVERLSRIFGAPAVVDDHDAARVRIYDIDTLRGVLRPVERPA